MANPPPSSSYFYLQTFLSDYWHLLAALAELNQLAFSWHIFPVEGTRARILIIKGQKKWFFSVLVWHISQFCTILCLLFRSFQLFQVIELFELSDFWTFNLYTLQCFNLFSLHFKGKWSSASCQDIVHIRGTSSQESRSKREDARHRSQKWLDRMELANPFWVCCATLIAED